MLLVEVVSAVDQFLKAADPLRGLVLRVGDEVQVLTLLLEDDGKAAILHLLLCVLFQTLRVTTQSHHRDVVDGNCATREKPSCHLEARQFAGQRESNFVFHFIVRLVSSANLLNELIGSMNVFSGITLRIYRCKLGTKVHTGELLYAMTYQSYLSPARTENDLLQLWDKLLTLYDP